MSAITSIFTQCLLFVSVLIATMVDSFPVTPDMKSFSSAIKNGHIETETPYMVYSTDNGPGAITEQWFTGGVFDENTIVRYFIDGDTDPTIEFLLFLGHGIGFTAAAESGNAPYANKRIGHNAHNGALFDTYRIPYQKSVIITIETVYAGTFWYIVRGVTNYRIMLGDLLLPADTRLRLYKNEDVMLEPLEFLTMVDVKSSAGAVFQVTIAANSGDMNFLEACVRVKMDDEDGYEFLSSGTEDFFLSAYYYDAGLYHGSHAGCTYKNTGINYMSAYKFFELDPVLFTQSLQMLWRCGESQSAGHDPCPNTFTPPATNAFGSINNTVVMDPVAAAAPDNPFQPQLENTRVTTYAWVYEYSLDD